jgi:hypothetical protein
MKAAGRVGWLSLAMMMMMVVVVVVVVVTQE